MNTEKAMLNFLGYKVDKMFFTMKTNFEKLSDQIVLSPSFSRTITSLPDDSYEVTIGVVLKQENLPFDTEISLSGRFKYNGDFDTQKMLKVNAVAILYPYVRSTLSMLTTIASIPPVIIPPINLAQMFENEEKKGSAIVH